MEAPNVRLVGMWVCALAVLAVDLPAQTASPTPARAPEEQVMRPPTDQQPAGGLSPVPGRRKSGPQSITWEVTVQGEPPDPSKKSSANAGALKGIQAIDLKDDVGRVKLADGTEQTIKPGDTLAGHKVVQVMPGRVVLNRVDQDGNSGLVIIQFDPQGNGRVIVLTTRDPKPVKAPPLK